MAVNVGDIPIVRGASSPVQLFHWPHSEDAVGKLVRTCNDTTKKKGNKFVNFETYIFVSTIFFSFRFVFFPIHIYRSLLHIYAMETTTEEDEAKKKTKMEKWIWARNPYT